jgi:hypothetical protein
MKTITCILMIAFAFGFAGCAEMGDIMKNYAETDRMMQERANGSRSSTVAEKYYYYVLSLDDGSSVCKRHNGRFDPRTLVGGYVGNKRIVNVQDGLGSCN